MSVERTFVMIKPDGVQRGLIGECISRFERTGLRLVALKMTAPEKSLVEKHYGEDIAIRRGEFVRQKLMDYVTNQVVVAMIWEGDNAIEVIRKIVGSTEPKGAPPGTIRGDFAHHSYALADEKNIAVANIIHASADKKDAENEIPLWFGKEYHDYKKVDHAHHFGQ